MTLHAAAQARVEVKMPQASRRMGTFSHRVCLTAPHHGCDGPHVSKRPRRTRISSSSASLEGRFLPFSATGLYAARAAKTAVNTPQANGRQPMPVSPEALEKTVLYCTEKEPPACFSTEWNTVPRRVPAASEEGLRQGCRGPVFSVEGIYVTLIGEIQTLNWCHHRM